MKSNKEFYLHVPTINLFETDSTKFALIYRWYWYRGKHSNEKQSDKLNDPEHPLGEFEYHQEVKRRGDDVGSKSARRICAKSIGSERSANRNEFSSLKWGKSDRTIKSYREKLNEKECYNDNFDSGANAKGKNLIDGKIRYKNLGMAQGKLDEKDNIKETLKNFKTREDKPISISPEDK